MKTSNQATKKTRVLALIVSLTCCASTVMAQPDSPASAGPGVTATVSFSPGVRDILKMLDAKVDVGIVQTYIKNSTSAYNPTASEIIALKQRGVPDEVITSVIQRGAEVRA